jgi:thioredoxin-like negative regulator of GroEL
VKGEFNIAKVDATVQTALAKRFGVESFPSLKFFAPGAKSDATA